METRENKIKRINLFLDVYSDEQLDILELVIETYSAPFMGKGDLMKLVLTEEEYRKCDSALPINSVGMIRELIPGFKADTHVFDYSSKVLGEMRNLTEDLHEKLKGLNAHKFI